MKFAAAVLWFAGVAQVGLVMGQSRAEIVAMIRDSAKRHGVDPERTLKLAWAESRYRDVVRIERNGKRSCGPMQAHTLSFPGICEVTLAQRIDAPVKWFAGLVRKHGLAAERVYVHGHP